MAANDDDILISISSDTTAIRRQLRQLGDDIGKTTTGIQKQFDGLGKGIDQSLTPMQKRINAMVGIPVASKVKEWRGALSDVGGELEKTGHTAGTTNTSLQAMLHSVRSIGEQLALGISPTQALTGQLSHLSYVATQPGGITGALKAIGGMAAGLVTKFPYVTAAVAAAGVAFVAYEALGGEKIKTLDEILAQHEANIKRLGPAYDFAKEHAKTYAEDPSVVSMSLKQDAKDAQRAIQDALSKARIEITEEVFAKGPNGEKIIQEQYKPFFDAIQAFLNGGTLDEFRKKIADIGAAQPNFEDAAGGLNYLTQRFADTIGPLTDFKSNLGDAETQLTIFKQAIDGVKSDTARQELEGLAEKIKEGTTNVDEIITSFVTLSQTHPDLSAAMAEFRKLALAAYGASEAVNTVYGNQGAGRTGRQKLPAGLLPDSVDVVPEHANKEDLGAAYDKAQEKAARKNKFHAPAITADDQFANDLQSIKDRTTALQQEYNMLGLSYEAQQKRKISLQLEQTALKQVREEARKKGDADWQNAQLTPDQIAKIDQVSEAYARQADQLKKAQEAQQLQRDILQGVFDDLRTSLEQGQLSWKTFADIAIHALDKVIAKIENDLIDSIMQANSASGGGGFLGGLFGLLGIGGGSSSVFPGGGVLNSTGGLYDTGGYTGDGGKKQVAGLVHKGEVVFSQDDIARLGGVSAVEAMRRGRTIAAPNVPRLQTPANSSSSQAVNINVNVEGANGDAHVVELVRQGVSAGIQAYDRGSTTRTVAAIRTARTNGLM